MWLAVLTYIQMDKLPFARRDTIIHVSG